jgi:hypothetical protein
MRVQELRDWGIVLKSALKLVCRDVFLNRFQIDLPRVTPATFLKVAPPPLTFEATFVCLSPPRYNPANYVNPV